MRFRESRRPVLFIRVLDFGILQEHTLNTFMRSQDSSVDIVTRLRAGQSRIQIAAKARFFFLKCQRRSVDPVILLFSMYG